ncbi:hypothetical protein TNCV_3020221 [Trichonephila clavipes]|nr:hypothetical protein TNCV_3020221 [Trichonephila clavipes]
MPLPLIETGISVKAGSFFVPLVVSFGSFGLHSLALFILVCACSFLSSLRFGASRTRFGLFAPFLRSSPLALLTSLLFRSRSASPSSSLPLRGE